MCGRDTLNIKKTKLIIIIGLAYAIGFAIGSVFMGWTFNQKYSELRQKIETKRQELDNRLTKIESVCRETKGVRIDRSVMKQ